MRRLLVATAGPGDAAARGGGVSVGGGASGGGGVGLPRTAPAGAARASMADPDPGNP